MIRQKSILYFDDFEFGDGSSKPKYLIVIKELDNKLLLYNLPSSQNYFNLSLKASICHYVDHGLNGTDHCFCFMANESIGEEGFSFPLDTYCFFSFFTRSLLEANADALIKRNPKELDLLSDKWYFELLYCIFKGKDVPLKYKSDIERMLGEYY